MKNDKNPKIIQKSDKFGKNVNEEQMVINEKCKCQNESEMKP